MGKSENQPKVELDLPLSEGDRLLQARIDWQNYCGSRGDSVTGFFIDPEMALRRMQQSESDEEMDPEEMQQNQNQVTRRSLNHLFERLGERSDDSTNHPFCREFADAVLPQYLKFHVSKELKKAIKYPYHDSFYCTQVIKYALSINCELALKILRRFPRVIHNQIQQAITELVREKPEFGPIIHRIWPKMFQVLSMQQQVQGMSEEEAYLFAKKELARGSKEYQAMELSAKNLCLVCEDIRTSCRPLHVGILRAFVESKTVSEEYVQKMIHLWNMYASSLSKRAKSESQMTGSTLIKEFETAKKFYQVICEAADQHHNPPLLPLNSAFFERCPETNKDYLWIRDHLKLWPKPLREEVMKCMPWSKAAIQDLREFFEREPAYKRFRVRAIDYLRYHNNPIVAAILLPVLKIEDLADAINLQGAQEHEREAWYAVLLQKMNRGREKAGSLEIMQRYENFRKLWESRASWMRSETRRKEWAKNIRGHQIYSLADLHSLHLDNYHKVDNASKEEMVHKIAGTLVNFHYPNLILEALRMLNPKELDFVLSNADFSEMKFDAHEERKLARYIYRSAQAEPILHDKEFVHSIGRRFQAAIDKCFHGTDERRESTQDVSIGTLLGPRLAVRSIEQGNIRRAVPISDEQKRDLIAWARRVYGSSTDTSVIRSFGYHRQRATHEIKEVAPFTAGLVATILLGSGIVFGIYQLLTHHAKQQETAVKRPDDAPPKLPLLRPDYKESDPPSTVEKLPPNQLPDQEVLDPPNNFPDTGDNEDADVQPDNPLAEKDLLTPHAPDPESGGGTEAPIEFSEDLTGRDAYLVQGFFGNESGDFSQENLHTSVEGQFYNDLLRDAQRATRNLPDGSRRNITMHIPKLRIHDTVPLPIGASYVEGLYDMNAEGEKIPRRRSAHEAFLYATSAAESVDLSFQLPKEKVEVDAGASIQDIRNALPEDIRDGISPELSLDVLEQLAPDLVEAIKHARTLPAHEAASHLEETVRKFITYEAVKAYEDTLGKSRLVDTEGRHEYLEMILDSQKGECAQATRLLQELFAHIGLPAVTVDCFHVENRKAFLKPRHAALGWPMLDKNGDLFLEIFDGTPTSTEEKDTSQLHDQDKAGSAESEERRAVSPLVSPRIALLVLLALLAAGGTGYWLAKRSGGKRKKIEQKEGTEILADSEVQPVLGDVKKVEIMSHDAVVQPRKPVEKEIPTAHLEQVAPKPLVKIYPPWDEETIIGMYTDAILSILNNHSWTDAAEGTEGIRLIGASKDIEQALDMYTGQVYLIMRPILHTVMKEERLHLCETVALWMGRILATSASLEQWFSDIQQAQLDSMQVSFLQKLLEPQLSTIESELSTEVQLWLTSQSPTANPHATHQEAVAGILEIIG